MNTTTNQVSINPITEDTDVGALNMELKNWDVEINGVPYQVVRIKGHVHSISGRSGACDLWAYPRSESPTTKNLVKFNVYNPVSWGIVCKPKNYLCHNDGEACSSNSVIVTRNGEKFYTCSAKGMNAGIDEARIAISAFIRHPLGLNNFDYEEKMKGRVVYYRGVKAVITKFLKEQACVMVAPAEGTSLVLYPFDYKIAPNKDGEIKVSILDTDLYFLFGDLHQQVSQDEIPSEEAIFSGLSDQESTQDEE